MKTNKLFRQFLIMAVLALALLWVASVCCRHFQHVGAAAAEASDMYSLAGDQTTQVARILLQVRQS